MNSKNITLTTLTRQDYIDKVKNHSHFEGFKPYHISKMAIIVIDVIKNILASKQSISFAPQGNLIVVYRDTREVINPSTGNYNLVKKGYTVRFRKLPLGNDYITKSVLVTLINEAIDVIDVFHAEILFDVLVDMIKDVSKGDCRVELRGLGSFNPHTRKLRGKSSTYIIKFRPTKGLINLIN